MPRKKASRARRSGFATQADIASIHRTFDERREWLEKLERTCSTQFARIAQIQAELDAVRREVAKLQARTSKNR